MDAEQEGLACCYKLLQMVGALHARGHQRLRIFPYVREMWWRCEIAPGAMFDPLNGVYLQAHESDIQRGLVAGFGSGAGCKPFGWTRSISSMSVSKITDKFLDTFPALGKAGKGSDWAYAGWYQDMLRQTCPSVLPMAMFSDAYEHTVFENLRLFPIGEARGGEMLLPPVYSER